MHLKRVEALNWRGLQQVALEDLSEGLNLIIGPNESGKSRLFEAIRYGLLVSSKGNAGPKRQLQSWLGQGSPEVRLEFHYQGQDYSLIKRYLRKNETQLSGAGQRLSGDEAEGQLAQMLGFSTPTLTSKRTLDNEKNRALLGHWPLLWMPQGV
ncbi:MAG: AAA family ATPase, partial [Magnetococcales bacterium]|nr:AAA family ATPase [Magnetococcales bacterium]